MTATLFSQMGIQIIREQELIIGPLAWDEARKVQGLHVIGEKDDGVEIEGANPQEVINRLVVQYEKLFGRASREVCKEAVINLISGLPKDQVPTTLL